MKKILDSYGKYYFLKVFFLSSFLLSVSLALSVVPGCCDGFLIINHLPVYFWTTLVLFLWMAYYYCKSRDYSVETKSRTYKAIRFQVPQYTCISCGTETILIYRYPEDSSVESRIVLPGMTLQKETVYYCPHCMQIREHNNLLVKKFREQRRLYKSTVKLFFFDEKRAYKMSSPSIKIRDSLLTISSLLTVVSGFGLWYSIIALPVWWVSLFLVILSFFHVLDSHILEYRVTDRGILRKSLRGYQVLRWGNINLVAEVSGQDATSSILCVFTNQENWIMTSVLNDYSNLFDEIYSCCMDHQIPFFQSS